VAVAVELVHLDGIAAKARGQKGVEKRADIIEIDEAPDRHIYIHSAQQRPPAVGADHLGRLKKYDRQRHHRQIGIGQHCQRRLRVDQAREHQKQPDADQ
jgi:hypothetical protein